MDELSDPNPQRAPSMTTYKLVPTDDDPNPMVYGEISWVTELDWFDDRDSEIELIEQTWLCVDEKRIVLPDPFAELFGEEE